MRKTLVKSRRAASPCLEGAGLLCYDRGGGIKTEKAQEEAMIRTFGSCLFSI